VPPLHLHPECHFSASSHCVGRYPRHGNLERQPTVTAAKLLNVAAASPTKRLRRCSRGYNSFHGPSSGRSAHEMIQPQLRSIQQAIMANTDRITACIKPTCVVRPHSVFNRCSLVLTSLLLCGEIKVKVGCGRIKSCLACLRHFDQLLFLYPLIS
jgi:hypothetical protein